MITLISSKKPGGYKIMRNTVVLPDIFSRKLKFIFGQKINWACVFLILFLTGWHQHMN
jgi:hypothetical protein